MLNGCVSKNEFQPKTKALQFVKTSTEIKPKALKQPSWGKMASIKVQQKKVQQAKVKKEDCLDCYVTPPMDYSKPPSLTNNAFLKFSNKPKASNYAKLVSNNRSKSPKRYGKYVYNETASDTTVKPAMHKSFNQSNVISAPSVINSSYGSLTNHRLGSVAIQVGAFSKYSGAKSYEKRYASLTNRYRVAIKTGTKNNKPIHRVRIEGFQSNYEAKKFMNSYGISDGFLVRK